ncbi:SDR family NAD(P)-dependent oxidoreductase [Streptomyces sp. NPDC057257]|uniref:SDR family NAD(P)-dependent oxidoreductase n=1 Tax=Streptomyces sp. NPDC057257 TaxID=3346071 RepID=UPI0036296CEF
MPGLMQDKVAIVSGAGQVGGLGHESALLLAQEGAKVVVSARSEEGLKASAKSIEEAGGTVLAVPTDITDPAQCARLVDATVAEFGRVDCLVNNAFNASPRGMLGDADLDAWRGVFEVNFWGSARLCQLVLPHMKAQRSGSIVNVLAHIIFKPQRIPDTGMFAYACSKNALYTLTQALALEVAEYGIRVNSHVPGYMDGPTVRDSFERLKQQDEKAWATAEGAVLDMIPQRRIPPTRECAKSVLFFASDQLSSVVTGQALLVNGGEALH